MTRRVFINQHPAATADAAAASFGAALRVAREAKRESQADTAAAVGTWQKTISKLERGDVRGVPFALALRLVDRFASTLVLVPRDQDVARYRDERAAAEERRRAHQLPLLAEVIQEARTEYLRATGGARRGS
jgi:transcriptional regulator with XRE-family HTH domain